MSGSEWDYTVGDPNSSARGSGARANGGKPQMDLIPIRTWLDIWSAHSEVHHELYQILCWLADWQEGDEDALAHIFQDHVFGQDAMEAVRVLEYGVKKYAAWNWAKGMKWSIPVGCILRHSKAIFNGETVDPESGCEHIGHVVANLVMLQHFQHCCPDLNDIQVPALNPRWHEENKQ